MNTRPDTARLTEVFVERRPDPGSTGPAIDLAPTDCFRLHRVHWLGTCKSKDGTRLICRFRAPDAESVRIALRQSGISFDAVWAGTTPPR